MKASKTISVQSILDFANLQIAFSNDTERLYRVAIINMIEHVLHESGNHAVFRYLKQDETHTDSLPGIREWDKENGCFDFSNTDDTKRHYC